MPQAAHVVQMSLRGTINDIQSWSIGFWFTYDGAGGTTPSADDVANGLAGSSDLAGFVSSFWANIETAIAPNTKLLSLGFRVFGESGTNPSVSEAPISPPMAGTSSLVLPPEVALVASLRSARAGASYRGRVYVPLSGAIVEANGQASPSQAANLASRMATMLLAINGHTFEGADAISYSLTSVVNSVTKSTTTDIVLVSVDTRFDSQRRREDKLPGQIESAPVLGP